jgi:hypothetical protein
MTFMLDERGCDAGVFIPRPPGTVGQFPQFAVHYEHPSLHESIDDAARRLAGLAG